jgi:hypothetical protein
MGFSPVRHPGWWRPMASRVETSIRLEKELLAQFLSCKGVVQSLGHALSVARSEKMKAHWRWRMSSVGSAIEAGALAR